MRYQWWIHGHINFVLLSSSAFCDMYDEVMQPAETTEAYQTLQGFHTRSVDASQGVWELSRIVKDSPTLSSSSPRRRRTRSWPRSTSPTTAARSTSSSTIPRRVRLAQRRRLRPRRHPVAGGPVDRRCRASPASSAWTTPRIPSCCTGRQVSQREELLGRRRGRSWPRSRQARQVRRALRGRPLQLPAHRGPRVLHRPARRRRVPPVRARCRRPPRRTRASSTRPTTCSSSTATRCSTRCANGGDRRADGRVERRATFEAAGKVVAAGRPRHAARDPRRAARPVHGRASCSACSAWCRPRRTPTRTSSGRGRLAGHRTPATARVVRSLAEAQDLEEGEVMVCEMTLPPWVPLFSIAGAVVTDVGGVLSHCAIVAREFDVPAVVGRGQAPPRSRPVRPSPSTAPRASSTSTAGSDAAPPRADSSLGQSVLARHGAPPCRAPLPVLVVLRHGFRTFSRRVQRPATRTSCIYSLREAIQSMRAAAPDLMRHAVCTQAPQS